MPNPWLDIPEGDYVGHMSSPAVGQLPALARIFAGALQRFRPRDVLLLGCATGNGLAHVDPAVTRRVSCVDINPAYVRSLAAAFPSPGFALDAHCADLDAHALEPEAFDLVYAALLLEYLDWPPLLPRVAGALRRGGAFAVVLQRPSETAPAVTPTPFTSLHRLESIFRFVDPADLVERARTAGFELREQRTEPLPSGKAFEVLTLALAGR